MPNWCFYEMVVGGRRENVDLFVKVLTDKDFPLSFSRILDKPEEVCVEDYGLYRRITYHGYCAWSVYCCMLPGDHTYYKDRMERMSKPLNVREVANIYNRKYKLTMPTHLIALSEQLNLSIAVYSEEPGVGFSELIHIENGELIENDCTDYAEYVIEDYDTYEDLCKEYAEGTKPSITEQQFNDAKEEGLLTYRVCEHDPEILYDMVPSKPIGEKQRLYRIVNNEKG